LPADSDDETIVNKLKRLKGLRQRSVDVVVLQADVTKLEELETVCTPYIESGELKGIFHLAGTYTQYNINQMSLNDFNQVTAPKIKGTLNLQHIVRNYKLDQFVLFSSAASVWGAATGAHYGAGNSFLDSFAQYFSSTSTVVKSINWGGMWEGSGIIPDEHMANFLAVGIKMTDPSTGLRQLGAIMRQNRVNTVVAPVDWTRFISVMSAFRPNNLFETISTTSDKQCPSEETVLFTLAGELSSDENLARVERLVESLVKKTLGIAESDAIPHDKGFYDLGLDSLTSIDLKNKLDKKFDFTISTTDLFDYSTVQLLSTFLMEKLDISRPVPEAGAAPAVTVDGYEEAFGSIAELEDSEVDGEDYSELTDMGDVQLLEVLEAELESLGQ
jgi:acyl carrier protein/short-subunit dehydrogenase